MERPLCRSADLYPFHASRCATRMKTQWKSTAGRSALRQRLSVRRDLSLRGVGAALALPYADTDMKQLHLDEISRNIAAGAHAVLAARPRRMAYHRQARRAANITPAPRSSTRSRTSGSISARTGSQTPSLKITKPSSTPHATHGESSSPSPNRSRPSACVIRPTSVSRHDPWY